MATENIIGFLSYDPELRFTWEAKALCTFNLYDTEQGEYNKRDRIVAWEELGERCAEELFESSKVFIKGKRSTRTYTNNEGETKSYEQVTAYRVFELDNTPQEMNNAREIKT